jgi:hypothetical protein
MFHLKMLWQCWMLLKNYNALSSEQKSLLFATHDIKHI